MLRRQQFQNSARGVDQQIALTTGRSSWCLSRRFLRSAAAASRSRPVQDGARLMMLVLHDDVQRKYAYGPAQGLPDTKVGTFTQALYDEPKKSSWRMISRKNDWKRIFAFE
jgi:hypothetical protein